MAQESGKEMMILIAMALGGLVVGYVIGHGVGWHRTNQIKQCEHLIMKWAWYAPVPGEALRQRLGQRGFKLTAPRFYLLMALMERDGLVTNQIVSKEVQGHLILERTYQSRR